MRMFRSSFSERPVYEAISISRTDLQTRAAAEAPFDQLDWVGPVGRRFPVTEFNARDLLTQVSAELEPLRARHGPPAQRAVPAAIGSCKNLTIDA